MKEEINDQTIKLNNANDNIISLYFVRINKRMIVAAVVLLIILGGILSLLDQSLNILYAILILLGIIIILILFSDRKVVFIKNEAENTLTAKVYNYLR